MKDVKNINNNDLHLIKKLIYDQYNVVFDNLKLNTENLEYGACSFQLNGKTVEHRISKITPAKNGQFVTIWKRNQNGITEPFDVSDPIDFIIITTRNGENLGQFIFPKQILAEKGILTQNNKIGKRGIRVYPPWDIPQNKQAEKTQNWQIKFFLNISQNNLVDLDFAKELFIPNN